MKKSLRRKIAEKIDRACQYDDWGGSIFEDDDTEAKIIQDYYLKIADQIIRLAKKDLLK